MALSVARALLIALGLFVTAAIANAADWQTYVNHEHGFQMDYPAHLFSSYGPAEDGDGTTFRSIANDKVLSIYGFQNGDELPIKTVRNIVVENYSDREITYERQKNNWLVLSGFQTDDGVRNIFYHRLASNRAGDRFAVFEFVWPESARADVDHLLKRMTDSLTSPKK